MPILDTRYDNNLRAVADMVSMNISSGYLFNFELTLNCSLPKDILILMEL